MHGMTTYFLRRLLLVPLTFICITLLVYTILRLTPGGPIEQARLQVLADQSREGGGGEATTETGELLLPQEALDELKKYYNLDRSIPVGYLIWLGAWPKKKESSAEYRPGLPPPPPHDLLCSMSLRARRLWSFFLMPVSAIFPRCSLIDTGA